MSEIFCQAPWSHAFINNDGKVYPCVFSVGGDSTGDINNSSLLDIWTTGFTNTRNHFQKNKSLPSCGFCLENEKNSNKSMRSLINNQERLPWSDGPRVLGIKFSNVCNLKCRICGPKFSSAWVDELADKSDRITNLPDNFIDKISSAIKNTEFFHFTGGEPLLATQHLTFLNWLKVNKPNSILTYNTNLTHLTFNNVDFIKEWRHFKKIYINFSIDAWGKRAEYLRTGTKWIDIEKNINLLKMEPNIEIIYYISLYAQNIVHLPVLIENIRKQFKARSEQFFLNYVVSPHEYHISSLPPEYRDQLINEIKTLQNNLFIEDGALALSLITQLTSLINILKKEYIPGKWQKALEKILKNEPLGMQFFDYFSEFDTIACSK
jgi:radical SAM protein with 4Fe4S-binding SPASM domain